MPFCSNCGTEVSKDARFCPSCGIELAGVEVMPVREVKRHASLTMCAVLLFICAVIHIINLVDWIAYGDLASSFGQLFFAIFASVSGYFLLKSKKVGGIMGLAYAIITGVVSLTSLASSMELYVAYGFVIDLVFSIVIVILIIIGWKHLQYPR